MQTHEGELIQKCRRGDGAALADLVDLHQAAVYGLARHMLGDPEEAGDVFQTVFLRLFERLEQIEPERGARAWLRKTPLNECLDRIKARSRTEESVDGDALESTREEPPDAAEGCEVQQALRQALDALPPRRRAAVVLRYTEDLSYREIAKVLGVSVETVRSALKRARLELRRRLQRYY